jgi:hypothetical protein
MKKLVIASLIAIAALAATLINTGCKTTPEGVTVVDTNTVQQIAVVFRNASRTSALMVIADEPGTKQWFQLAQASIGQFVAGTKHDPQAFKDALAKLPQLSNKWATFIVGNVVDAYEIYYINYSAPLNDKSAGTWVACQFLKAIQDGFSDATAGTVTSGAQTQTLEQAKVWLKAKTTAKAATKK